MMGTKKENSDIKGNMKRVRDMFARGYNINEVRSAVDTREMGRLRLIQADVLSKLNLHEMANGPCIRPLEKTRFGTRLPPPDIAAENLSILDIADGRMNGEGRYR